MNLIRTQKDQFIFHLGKRERQLLLAVLKRYPLIPSSYQSLSKSPAALEQETNQRLLDEALAEQRRDNKRHLDALLKDRLRFKEVADGCRMTLTVSDVEWLLQVLNDIRVGSWIVLGSPDKDRLDPDLNEETAPHVWAMEMAGYFQAHLLEGLP